MSAIAECLSVSACKRAQALCISTAGLLFLPAVAHAEPAFRSAETPHEHRDAKIDTARNHFFRGVEFYGAGDYRLALVEFQRAYDLSKNYRVLFNIGQVNQQLNNYTKAILALEEYLRRGGDSIPAQRRAAIEDDLNALRRKVAQVEIVLNVQGAELLIDQVPSGRGGSKRRITLDAGDHFIEARQSGYQNTTRMLTVVGGENAKLTLHLAKLPPSVVHKTKDKEPSSLGIWAGWTATGAFAVGAGVLGALAISHTNDLSALRASPTSTNAERQAAENKAKTFAVTADILTAAAVVTGGVTLYFTLSRDSKSEAQPRSSVALRGSTLLLTHEH